MEIVRQFTKPEVDPFTQFKYESYDCVIRDWKDQTKIKFQLLGAEVPTAWSKNARDILIEKYFRKGGVPLVTDCARNTGDTPEWLQPRVAAPGSDVGSEHSVQQVVRRLAGHWTYEGWVNKYFDAVVEQMDRELQPGEIRSLDFELKIAPILRERNARAFYDELCYMLLNQMAAPNSPQWFNTGLWWAYGIDGKGQGHYYVCRNADTRDYAAGAKAADNLKNMGIGGKITPESVADIDNHNRTLKSYLVESQTSYRKVQAHACFILNVEDKICGEGGIFDWIGREARIFKYGSGSGANVSKVRGKHERLSGGGKSSGVMSFLKVADYAGGVIKSGGTTRRAAKMVVLNVDHPDVLDFIHCKVDSEIAVAALLTGSAKVNGHCQGIIDTVIRYVKMDEGTTYSTIVRNADVEIVINDALADGVSPNYCDKSILLAMNGVKKWPGQNYDSNFEGKAYEMVPFQNANHSVRIPTEFYMAVDMGKSWDLTARKTGDVVQTVDAKGLEWEIAKAGYFCGDPGTQYDTIINDWNTTPVDGRINGANPCSEYMHLDGTACNLASLRLGKFIGEDGQFNVKSFRHGCHLWTIVLDITNSMVNLPDRDTAIGTYNYRNIGLGYADLGATLMSFGLPYDSDEGRALAAAITAIMHAEAHLTSATIAQQLGAYPRFWPNREHHLRVVRNHMAALIVSDNFEGLTVEPSRLDRFSLRRAVGTDAAIGMVDAARQAFVDSYFLAEKTGYRNAQLTLLAPTGTIAILMDCDTTGVEPNIGLIVFKTLVGGGEMKFMPPQAVKAALNKLGYPPAAVEAIYAHIRDHEGNLPAPVGRMAPAHPIHPEHVKVFQTSLSNDPNNPPIRWQGHVLMMAAVQPFLSGAISKTINMSESATIEDVRSAYRMAHDLSLKSMALYRNGSKLSQPLNLKKLKPEDQEVKQMGKVELKRLEPVKVALLEEICESLVDTTNLDKVDFNQITADTILLQPRTLEPGEKLKAAFNSPPQIGLRHLLPSRRKAGIDIAVSVPTPNGKNAHLYVKTSRYEDGRCGEIWITYSADQGIIQALMTTICKTANLALQHGVPLAAIIKSWDDSVFEPAGMTYGHEYIKFYKSIVNLASKILAFEELGNLSVLDVQPEAVFDSKYVTGFDLAAGLDMTVTMTKAVDGPASVSAAPTPANRKDAYDPVEKCPKCGSPHYVQTGTCKTCRRCGFNPGCG